MAGCAAEKANLSELTAETYVGLPSGEMKDLFHRVGLGRSQVWAVRLAAGILSGERVDDDTLQKVADSVTEPHFREILPQTALRGSLGCRGAPVLAAYMLSSSLLLPPSTCSTDQPMPAAAFLISPVPVLSLFVSPWRCTACQ